MTAPAGAFSVTHLDAFGDSRLDLRRQGRHILLTPAVDDADLGGAEPDGCPGGVHRDVAAADDDDLFAREVGQDIVAEPAQELNGRHDAGGGLSLEAEFFIGMRADGEVNGVELFFSAFQT